MKSQKILGLALSLSLFSCTTYQKNPLETKKIIDRIDLEQQVLIQQNLSQLSYEDASRIMSENNPVIAELKALYEQSKALSEIKTPLANPSAGVGANIGRRIGLAEAAKTQPFLDLAFSIPLNGRLALQDDINKLQSDRQEMQLIFKHRKMAIELRHAYRNAILTQLKMKAAEQKQAWIQKVQKEVHRGLKAGLYNAMDSARLKSESLQQQSDRLRIRQNALNTRYQLALLLNKSLPALTTLKLDSLAKQVSSIDLKTLQKSLHQQNPKLKGLEAQYRLAEKQLEIEIRKQYPDLDLNFGFEQEPGEKRQSFAIGIGLELPVFDRNQQAISQADHQRKVIRLRYIKEASRLMLQLEKECASLKLAQERHSLFQNKLLPQVEKNFKNARRAVEAGVIDLQRYWDFQAKVLDLRSYRADSLQICYSSQAKIEKLINAPLAQ